LGFEISQRFERVSVTIMKDTITLAVKTSDGVESYIAVPRSECGPGLAVFSVKLNNALNKWADDHGSMLKRLTNTLTGISENWGDL
jgi:hypothetical protein